MRVVLEARTATRCSTCRFLNPLAGLRHQAECSNCAEPIDVAGQIRDAYEGGLTYAFGGYYDAVAESLVYQDDQPHELEDGRESSGSPFTLRKVPHFACHCGTPLDTPAPGAADLRCSRCGDASPIRWPDDRTREWDPRITYLVGDAGDRGVKIRPKLEGTVVGCGNCGAPLDRDGRQRVVICTHCRSENFLSDQILTKLYPRPESHSFYIVYELDDEAYADAFVFLASTTHYGFEESQEKFIRDKTRAMKDRILAARVKRAITNESDDSRIEEEVARAIVARSDLDAETVERLDERLSDSVRRKIVSDKTSAAFLGRWLASDDDDVRAIGARAAKGDALRACATDASPRVREIIAARADTPAEILAALRKDPDDDVREKARANASYQPGFFTRLLGG
jgi:hypothetical protein